LGSLTSTAAVTNLNNKYTPYNAFHNYDINESNSDSSDDSYRGLLFPHTIPYLDQDYLADIGLVSPVYYHHHDNNNNNSSSYQSSDTYSNYAKTIAETVTFGEEFKRRVYAPFDSCPRKNLGR
jgi:hypothetical protein